VAPTGRSMLNWEKFGTLWYGGHFGSVRKLLSLKAWALNSAVECHLHTVEVIGSNPIAPTIVSSTCRLSSFLRGSVWVQ